jgi:hypothetical protein
MRSGILRTENGVLVRPSLIRFIFTLMATASLLTACSMPRLAYQQADWLLLSKVDDYLDLRDEQRLQLEQVFQTQLARHRIEELPAIAQTLEEAGARAQRGMTEEDVRWSLLRGRELLASSAALLMPGVAATLSDLNAEQRKHLNGYLGEQIEEYAERYAGGRSQEELLERATERTVRRIERWTGSLSEEQIALVRDVSRSMPDVVADWVSYTQNRRSELLALLDSGARAPAIEDLLRKRWLLHYEMPARLAQIRAQRIEARIAMITRIARSLDSVQREHLVNRLQDLAKDMRSLLLEA